MVSVRKIRSDINEENMRSIPDSIFNELPVEIQCALSILEGDINDITAAVDSSSNKFIGVGHIVNGKFEKYNFDSALKNMAISVIEKHYQSMFMVFENKMIYYRDLGIIGERIFGYCEECNS